MRSTLALIILLVMPCTASAVHECGTRHDVAGHGCSHLEQGDFFYGDELPGAPALARRGNYSVGVRTLEVVNPDQLDILNYSEDNPNPRYDRKLTLEIWYPAKLGPDEKQITTYADVLGHGANNPDRPILPFEFGGRAAREALPLADDGPYPLLIVSHGFPGSRVLLTWLTENLASKGYVVVAIDHTESTHGDASHSPASTLIHRPRDINFVLHTVSEYSAITESFLAGLVDTNRTALIGYSMGSYGVLSAAGLGASKEAVNSLEVVPGGHLASLRAGSPVHEAMLDSRIKAVVAFAPYAPPGYWDIGSVKGLKIPSLFIVGSQDRTTGFTAAQWLFEHTSSSERYLLVFQGAIHEVATNPAPPLANAHFREYIHYQEPAWDNRRLNNINQHFVTAFLGKHLLGKESNYAGYLDISPISNDSPRTDTKHRDYWHGFANWTAIGMEFHHRGTGE